MQGRKLTPKSLQKSKDNMFIDNLTCSSDNGEEPLLIKKKKKKKKKKINKNTC